ncbi:MAG: hypothetical protein P1U38_09550 [Aeromicrobium sp.]|uniref:hypothetical protein n=1 Tax=Aeromicrobium sp. TaxID=1871063 RepID=UPI0026287C57|nr:hypothetical protein [Aeromicrobium sp.]MDF1705005.1 hypothetical protein [Aeromicrobium sp.]
MALEAGTVDFRDGAYVVILGGVPIESRWAGDYSPVVGDTVYVDRVEGRAVTYPIAGGPLPEAGTVTSGATNGTIGVLGDDGITYRARFSGTAPTSGTRAYLVWQNPQRPFAVAGELANITTDPLAPNVPTPPPPTPVRTGTLYVAAWGSGRGRPFGWEGGDVVQGRYGSNPVNRGAWFHNSAAQLAGATITGLRMFVPARVRVGNYNSAALFGFFRHTSGPGDDVNRVEGPHFVNLPGGWGGDWVPLPVAWAAGLIAQGGGIALGDSAGTYTYAGVGGTNARPDSGQLAIDWRR